MSTSQEPQSPRAWSDLPTETLAAVVSVLENKTPIKPGPLDPDDLPQFNFDQGRRAVLTDARTALENRRKASK